MNALLKMLIKLKATMVIYPSSDGQYVDIIVSPNGIQEKCNTLRVTTALIDGAKEGAFDSHMLSSIEAAIMKTFETKGEN